MACSQTPFLNRSRQELATAQNAAWKFDQHLQRMLAYRVPRAKLALMAGLTLQFTGALLLAVDLYRALAAAILIAFTMLASAVFHRWWLIADPLLRHLHLSNL